MPLALYPYQSDLVSRVREQLLAGRSRILVVLPTGGGKTCLTAHMIASAVAKEKRAWFTVHRQELVRQSVDTLQDAAGLSVGVIAAKFAPNSYHKAQVCSIQTLMRRWERFPLPDLLVVDEAHHVVSKSWSALLAAMIEKKPAMKVIGLTATPLRLDGRGLGQWFETIVEGPSTAELIAQKYLSPYKLFAPSMANLAGVHTVAGDYDKAELDDAMRGSCVVGDAIAEYRQKCAGKRALMFLWSVRASEQMAERLNEQGIPAAHIDGKTGDDERRLAVSRFRSGQIKVLCNVEICVEGFDVPACDAVFLLRPTQSLAMYLQMCGRGLRTAPKKEHVLLMDHSGLAFQHGLPDDKREWSLEGTDRKSRGKQEVPIRQCMKCYAVLPSAVTACKECGFVFPVKPREVQQETGELEEVTAEAMARLFAAKARKVEQGTAETLQNLIEVGRKRGYAPGWAVHVFEARQKKLAERTPVQAAMRGVDRLDDPAWQPASRLHELADQYRPKS